MNPMEMTARERALLEALLPRLDAATADVVLRLLRSDDVTTSMAGPIRERAEQALSVLLEREQTARRSGTLVHGLSRLIQALQELPEGTQVVRQILAAPDIVGSFYQLDEGGPGEPWDAGLGVALVDVSTQPAPLD